MIFHLHFHFNNNKVNKVNKINKIGIKVEFLGDILLVLFKNMKENG